MIGAVTHLELNVFSGFFFYLRNTIVDNDTIFHYYSFNYFFFYFNQISIARKCLIAINILL